MHPLLSRWRRLLLYLLAWVALDALLAAAAASPGGMDWAQALVSLAPACIVYAFVCLSPWYLCRVRPLGLATAPGLVLTWTVAAGLASLIFVGTAYAADVSGALPYSLLFSLGILVYLLSAGVHYAAAASIAAGQAEQRAAEARTLAREAELRALKAQVNPHFLFNSLNSISALTTADPARAHDMCLWLSDYLRGTLAHTASESIPLRDELALARAYLEVERVRFGDRLAFVQEVEPGCEDCRVPALLLQPLIENAVKHGIAGLVEGGAIRVSARRSPSGVVVSIENGFDPDASSPRKTGIGLANVRRRLALRYGDGANVDAGPADANYRVELRFPCESPMTASNRA